MAYEVIVAGLPKQSCAAEPELDDRRGRKPRDDRPGLHGSWRLDPRLAAIGRVLPFVRGPLARGLRQ